ncbi:carotenoid oxygenase family protein [Burkholderia stagnalis]|uniref:carotenoid oxygenase family protein n=1 Tax=Burkholderia stagnalis TaxID=1503054 RepID=UPI0007589BB9|nr:carotenoid oxygenase family protein [Burkholderia stagnalis]KVC57644.1 carotenoid oxygenase [Burkholderia stagnalis]KVN18981.1 carotenoid oxygenase [Burkholderia stagnalis]KWI73381.1 carotenoid oxygenase [Burkholderia stagnalis]KWK61363.1 carotenoid oxygenase [Burkholderia stagnalis]KWN18840.1 carotenoid oxygenase [Burkholderia stagnalis]
MTTFDLNSGAIAPVADEADLVDLRVTGSLPRELNGMLLRNGPNPLRGRFAGNDVLSWWPEDAMLHALSFEDGRVTGYRNRWARTRRWADVYAPARAASLPDTNPNVNVLLHAGEVLALAEGGAPLAIVGALDGFDRPRRHAGLGGGMTAHPKVDPRTGELMLFRADWQAPWLRYGVLDAQGVQTVDVELDLPAPSMMHDMAITATRSLLFDLNVGYDFSMLADGHRMPLRWHDERRARIGVLPRHGGAPRWFDIAPCFIQHVANAYDCDDGAIVLDVVRYPWFLRPGERRGTFDDNPLAVLWRYVIDPADGTVEEAPLGDAGVELPRINDAWTGRAYRYCYAVEQPSNAEMRGVVRYDLRQGTIARYAVPAGDQNSEPVFVARAGAADEDDGWVLTWVYRHATDTSDLVVLDARCIERGPVATVHLPRRVPAGFHGAWVPKVR